MQIIDLVSFVSKYQIYEGRGTKRRHALLVITSVNTLRKLKVAGIGVLHW